MAKNLIGGMFLEPENKKSFQKIKIKLLEFLNYNTSIHYWHWWREIYRTNGFIKEFFLFTDISKNDFSRKF